MKPLNVRRRHRLDDDDYVPPLGSLQARLQAQDDFHRLARELREDDDDRSSPSYIPPME
jgi:hypothetical protein